MEQELRWRLSRDATKIANNLGVIRSGRYYSEEEVIEILSKARLMLWDLILCVTAPQLKLWDNPAYDHSEEGQTRKLQDENG